ncbi:MAG TPA: tRNA (adenosine(37)-N6)-dimethylallyltransferase MiaA [Candidatus Saccharimonadales bacterium]|nr:tRNA (adenosine(37)-N6)-dimethylallyltransferase MiaA [Candidatus Saccharimonadales bacterium]
MTSPLLVIVGPTCTGKTTLAVAAAQALAPADILNADSRQVRRGLRVGTCAPSADELKGVRCELLDLCDPGESFTVADWLGRARLCLDRLDRSGTRAVVAGGTGLYVTALVDGFDLAGAAPDPERRRERTESAATPEGLETLVAELRARDPEGASAIDRRNPRRVIRALEILEARGGSLRTAQRRVSPRAAVMIGLDVDRPVHARWIEQRTAAMFEGGGIQEEVRRMLHRGLDRAVVVRCGIGYSEALDLIEGRVDIAAAVQATMQRTVRYARAQRTWFRRDTRVTWLRPDLVSGDELLAETLRLEASPPA